MADTREKNSVDPQVEFVRTKGSPITGRHKEKRERITEALCDLQLAIDGLRIRLSQSDDMSQLQQSCAALARACSIFLRKMVIGDRNRREMRLLDDEVLRSLDFGFDGLLKISPNRRRTLRIYRSFSGIVQMTKLDESSLVPEAVYRFPVAPHELKISIEWPLPGTFGWTETPTEKKPWEVSAEELFDTGSTRTLTCDEWLGQQLVMFDNRGISLKDVISTVVTYD